MSALASSTTTGVDETVAVLAHALLNRTAVITGTAEILRLQGEARARAGDPDALLATLVEQGQRVGEVLGLLARGRAADALALATARG